MTLKARDSSEGASWIGLLSVVLALAWLTQEHYPPWTAFHSDWIAAFGLVLALAWSLANRRPHSPVPAAACVAAALALVPLVQHGLGIIYFAGDAILASVYLLGFAAAVQLGCEAQSRTERAIEPLLWAILLAGLWSVALALAQWLRLTDGIANWAMPLRGARPYANFGQPNQLATFLVWGLLSAVLLFERGQLSKPTVCPVGGLLLLGVALTQSRAAWVQLLIVAAVITLLGRRAALRVTRPHVLGAGAIFLAFNLLLPQVSQYLWDGATWRPSAETASAGTRPTHWATVTHAIRESPWTGYGWNQTSVAAARTAPYHAASGEMIEHSHNIVLDVLAWNGVPLGGALLLAAAAWLLRLLRNSRDASSLLLMAIVLATLTHAMFEFPLEYAYMLLPVGIMLGVVQGRMGGGVGGAALPRVVWMILIAAGSAALGVVGVDYLRLEENHRQLRMESAGIGTDIISPDVPAVIALTQLHSLLKFARTEVTEHTTDADVALMRKVADRFGYPPVLFRYAIATALKGDRVEANLALIRICKQHPVPVCSEAQENWSSLQNGRYPELRSVPFPVVPR